MCCPFMIQSSVPASLVCSCNQGRVVRKAVSANPGLKVNQSINFSSIKMFFTTYDLCGLSLIKLKAERQTVETENLIEKLQHSNQNSR